MASSRQKFRRWSEFPSSDTTERQRSSAMPLEVVPNRVRPIPRTAARITRTCERRRFNPHTPQNPAQPGSAAACRTHSAICASSYPSSWMSTQRASLSSHRPRTTHAPTPQPAVCYAADAPRRPSAAQAGSASLMRPPRLLGVLALALVLPLLLLACEATTESKDGPSTDRRSVGRPLQRHRRPKLASPR